VMGNEIIPMISSGLVVALVGFICGYFLWGMK